MVVATKQENIGANLKILHQMASSHMPARVLATSLQLEIFLHISQGNKTATEIAHVTKASERGIPMLLDALVALQLLNKVEGCYELSPVAAEFLVPGKPDYLGDFLGSDWYWQGWSHLTEVMRTGKTFQRSQAEANKFFPTLVPYLHVVHREPARKFAKALGAGTLHQNMQVLDVACGSGIWGIAIAEADQQAHITVQDTPDVLQVTGRYLESHNIKNRYELLPGDVNSVEFGENRFDLALVANIIHIQGEQSSCYLFKRLYSALKPGGRLAIIDLIPNNERTGPVFPILFALSMLIDTEEGGTFTIPEYTRWLTVAGFGRVDTVEIEHYSPVIVGLKN